MKVDVALRMLAERQHGVMTREQARALGATRHHLRRRIESPDWEVVTSTVIRLVGTRRTFRQRSMVAALDAGPHAVVSHESAAALWRLPGFAPVHVSRSTGRSGRLPTTAVLHQTCRLPDTHVGSLEGIPVTSPARTIFDLSILTAAGLPPPARQRELGGQDWVGRVDFLYPDQAVVMEIDSDLHHSSALHRAADARRDDALGAAGYTVVRIREHQVWHRPEEVVAQLRIAVGAPLQWAGCPGKSSSGNICTAKS